jgi:Asp-tRNA(Asn)/Glu-tRNA(Gln) amidotransferase A subunit family amidase
VAGRIAWILAGGAAIIGGMMMQDRLMFGWGDDGPRTPRHSEVEVGSIVNEVIGAQTDRLTVVSDDGAGIDVPPEVKRKMAQAVADLVKAEAALAVADLRDQPRDQLEALRDRRAAARDRVDQLADQIKDEEQREGVRDSKHEIRDQIRSEIRDALRS